MSTIERPQFYEGQILAAADLSALLEYGRAQDARDRRTLHLWGIAEGLGLEVSDGEIAVNPGLAVDSSGVQIVVPEQSTLTPADLPGGATSSNGTSQTAFPVFLSAAQEASSESSRFGRCATSEQSSRIEESFELSIGRAAEATDWDDQDAPDIGDGPDDSAASARRILLGFAVFDASSGEFTEVSIENSDGVRPRYVGVRADAIESLSGRIAQHTQPAGTSGGLMLVLDKDSADSELALGTDGGTGVISDPVFTVDSKGNVYAKGNFKAEGTLQGTLATSEALVQSGVTSDGAVLPLPAGVTEETIKSNGAVVHIMLSPRIDLSSAPPEVNIAGPGNDLFTPGALTVIATVLECSVDEQRRVRCTLRWIDLKDVANSDGRVDRPGACDYTVIVAVPSS